MAGVVPQSSPTDRPRLAPKKDPLRSRVANGSALLTGTDQRSTWARRFRDLYYEIISDLGGPEILSEGQKQLTRRAATISLMCEKLEGEAAAGENINLDDYGKLTDRLGRTFHRLGLKRQQRNVTPNLEQYLEAKAQEVAE